MEHLNVNLESVQYVNVRWLRIAEQNPTNSPPSQLATNMRRASSRMQPVHLCAAPPKGTPISSRAPRAPSQSHSLDPAITLSST